MCAFKDIDENKKSLGLSLVVPCHTHCVFLLLLSVACVCLTRMDFLLLPGITHKSNMLIVRRPRWHIDGSLPAI